MSKEEYSKVVIIVTDRVIALQEKRDFADAHNRHALKEHYEDEIRALFVIIDKIAKGCEKKYGK